MLRLYPVFSIIRARPITIFFDIDYVFNVTHDGEYYNIVADVFIDNARILKKTVFKTMPYALTLGVIYSINYDGGCTGMAQADYIDKKSDDASNGLWDGSCIWGSNVTSDNKLYYVNANGLTKE